VKHDIFKTFKELKDEDISPTGKTITIESLGENGAIFKMYHEGDIQHQVLMSKEKIHHIKKKTHSHLKHIFKTLRKVNPYDIAKDKKFQRFKQGLDKHIALMKGGGTDEPVAKTTILVHDAVMDDVTTDKVAALQANVDMLQDKLNKRLKQKNTQDHNSYWGIFFLVNFLQTVITTQLVPQKLVYGQYWLSYGKSLIPEDGWHDVPQWSAMGTPLAVDLYGSIFMVVLNLVSACYPNEEMDEITKIAQYVYWSWLIVSAPWLIASMGWWGLASIISPVLGFYTSTQLTLPAPPDSPAQESTTKIPKSIVKLQQDLMEAKNELAAAIEAQANRE
jgi:hypothetical protein